MLIELLGCRAEEVPVELEAAVLDTMPTVIEVRWTTPEPGPSRVEFGLDGAFDRATPLDEGGTEHTTVLAGLPPDAEVSIRVDGAEPLVVATGSLPDVPSFTVEGEGGGLFAATTVLGERQRVVLLDPQARVTWVYEDLRGLEAFRALVLADGSGMAYLSSVAGGGPAPDSAIVEVGWDGVVDREILVPDLAHDLVQGPDGTYVALAFETRDGVLGNALLEVAPDGTTTSLWSSWDCFDPVSHPGDDPEQGWTHANALDYDPDADAFLVGMRNLGTIVEVDRASGACAWALGGAGGDLDVDGAQFVHEHQFDRTEGGLLVFDNDGAPGQESRVIEYTIDEAAGTATVARTFESEPPLFSFILGDVLRAEDGGTLIAWGAAGVLDRLAPDGTRTFRAELPQGEVLGFVHWLAEPSR